MMKTNAPRPAFTPAMRNHLGSNHAGAKLHLSSYDDRLEVERAFGAVTAWRAALRALERKHERLLARFAATPLRPGCPLHASARVSRRRDLLELELLIENAVAQLTNAIREHDAAPL